MLTIGEKLRAIREGKGLSQGDIEQRTKMLRCYTSRVENGHTVPSLETLQRYAHAFGVPLYQLFYDSDGAPKMLSAVKDSGERLTRRQQREMEKLSRQFLRLKERDRDLVRLMIAKLAQA